MIAIFPEINASVARGDVEALAVLVRRYFGGDETFAPKPSIAALIERAGLTVKHLTMPTYGALLAKDERGAFTTVLVVRPELGPLHERFLLAHLLGHYLLDVQPLIARGDWQVSGFQEALSPLERYEEQGTAIATTPAKAAALVMEQRADQFAAALLLPRGMLRKALEKLKDERKVAAFFGVTLGCLERRWRDLGHGAPAPLDFFDAEQQIGRGAEQQQMASASEEGASPSLSPVDGAMPRSYAASTYGATEKATRKAAGPGASKDLPRAQASAAPSEAVPGSGMDRLRELARRLDKGTKAR